MLKTLASLQSNKQLNLCLIYQTKNITYFKTKDELINFIKTKKDKLNIDLSGYGKMKRITKNAKQYLNNAKLIEDKINIHDVPKNYHITAEIKRSIIFTKKMVKYINII